MAASERFKVEPQTLRESKTRIEAMKDEYNGEITKLYNEVEGLVTNWKGTSSTTFNTQLLGLREDFNKLGELMMNYATVLENASKTYSQTDDSLSARVPKRV